MDKQRIGLIGATSLVGTCLLPLLVRAGAHVTAFSRRILQCDEDNIEWQQLQPLPPARPTQGEMKIEYWICVAPIWVLPDHFTLLEAYNARHVVVLSSTSRFTKDDSPDPVDQAIALRLVEAESRVQEWAEKRGIEWVILRPTLIYGFGRDKNIAEIAHFIRRFGFFPLFGKASGLRQPVHAIDVATTCIAALQAPHAANHAYNISGGETLAYREMVGRVFKSLDRRPHFLSIPLWIFKLALYLLRLLPRYKKWSAAMAMRMNADLVFDHSAATHDLGYQPRAFDLPALKQQADDDPH